MVLPGLDMALDDASWALIAGKDGDDSHACGLPAAGHAQFAMHALLDRIGITRADVRQLAPVGRPRGAGVGSLAPGRHHRALAQRARREGLQGRGGKRALEKLALIEAANAEEEALAIAVGDARRPRDPGKTVALVTPDRALARRVKAALERWQVAVDDSGGDALADTSAGLFARLAAEAALGGLEPVPLLALLKHPLLRLGQPQGAHDHACRCARTRAAARPAPEGRQQGPRPCARNIPRHARRPASRAIRARSSATTNSMPPRR